MGASRGFEWIAGIAISLLLAGCALPVRVVSVSDPKADAQGIRYLLRRPSYVVAVHFDAQAADFVEDDGGRYCVRPETRMKVRVRQTLDAPPQVYEVRAPGFPFVLAHLFSDIGFTVTLDENGALKAFTANESDKTIEVFEAVAAAVVGTAKGIVAQGAPAQHPGVTVQSIKMPQPRPKPPEPCLRIDDEKFQEYAGKHRALLLQSRRIDGALSKAERALEGSEDPRRLGRALETANLLRQEHDRLDAELKKVEYALPKGSYEVKVDGVVAVQKDAEHQNEWISIALKKVNPSAPEIPKQSGGVKTGSEGEQK